MAPDHTLRRWVSTIVACLVLSPATCCLADEPEAETVGPAEFIAVMAGDRAARREALRKIDQAWQLAYVAPLVEILGLTNNADLERSVLSVLRGNTRARIGLDESAWFDWLWSFDESTVGELNGYPEFKSWLYGNIDPKFRAYFRTGYPRTIRLDEVRWGGVHQDGIPPLRNPRMISAAEADYMEDDNVVFGLVINGDARAYPKRILAWHEMFVDEVGGERVAGVYCTLCGTMILYSTELAGVNHDLGTSGFLYRSNKLMYDQATQSLWSTLTGRPVIGPLANQDIELAWRGVVTTTWGEWRRRHPQSTVLSLDTGYDRDYREGAAYRRYFSTDRLMFNVPKLDKRLKNKAEILALRFDNEALAIDVEFLASRPVYADTIAGRAVVVLTDQSGASRVYERGDTNFVDYDGDITVTDSTGTHWQLSEATLDSPTGAHRARVPAHRAFWFGWYAAYNNTRLITE